MTGLLMELGPCRVNPGGSNTTYNPYSWNGKANIIFLDQPVNAGFSYSDTDQVASSQEAALNVYAFLQLFYSKFNYAHLDFHITGESYAGHYIPAIAATILDENASLKKLHVNDVESIEIKLASIAIGNGLTDPLSQYKYYPEMACHSSYDPILEQSVCDEMTSKVPTCEQLINACYNYDSKFTCVPASIYCNNALIGPVQQSGVNVYDVRTKCEPNNPLCYGIIRDIEAYMNNPDVQRSIGVDRKFTGCNMDINLKFLMNGDWMKPIVKLIPGILDSNVRVLIYAGDADFICNWMGNKAWAMQLEWTGGEGFRAAEDVEWKSKITKQKAGVYRSFEGLSFLRVYNAGHMTPYDQPEHSYEFINHWIKST